MLDGGDVEGVTDVVEAEAIVANAEPEFGRLDVLQALHVAFAGGGEVGQGMENAQRGGLIDSAELGLGLVFPSDLFPAYAYCPG